MRPQSLKRIKKYRISKNKQSYKNATEEKSEGVGVSMLHSCENT